MVDKAVEEAKKSPEPREEDLWTDIYYKGTEPSFMRGREREEVCSLFGKAIPRKKSVNRLISQVHYY